MTAWERTIQYWSANTKQRQKLTRELNKKLTKKKETEE